MHDDPGGSLGYHTRGFYMKGLSSQKIKLLVNELSSLKAKYAWRYYNRRKIYEHIKKHLAIRLVLSLDINEAVELIREKLPGYQYPTHLDSNLKIIDKIRFDYLWENIDYQRARSLILRLGIPEPYVLLAEFLLRDNGVTP